MKNLFPLLFIIPFTFSCDWAKKKVKSAIEEQTDKLFPKFDSHLPDTKNNKKRFKEFFLIDPVNVDSIYCFADNFGSDSDYSFTFKCDTSIIKRICDSLHLRNDTINEFQFDGLFHELDWWNKERISELESFWYSKEQRYYRSLWFDSISNKAYYFEFDL